MSMSNITHIVVHYSATFEDQNLTVKDIDKMHKARGWKGVGYHYVIRRDGVVEKGRPDNVVGAHVGGQNSGKIGICAIGGVNRKTGPDVGVDNRTPAQIKSQIALIKSLLVRYPKAKVVGHRDLAPTQCPGFDVIPWWKSVTSGVAKAAPPAPAKPIPDRPTPVAPKPPVAAPTPAATHKERNPFWAALFAILKRIFGRK
jgi:N-acetyl-anhydromuramyl-L-alanine amidase AmpD